MRRVLLRVPAMLCTLVLPWLVSPAFGGGNVVAWGTTRFGLSEPCANNVVAMATGYEQSILLKEDGTVVNCGMHWWPGSTNDIWDYPIAVPAGLNNVVAIAGGYAHSLALKSDGTVVAWGLNSSGQTSVPLTATDVVAISAAGSHSLALKSDGTVVGWGSGGVATNVPAGLSNVVAISAGSGVDLALKADGTVAWWGSSDAYLTNDLASLTDVVAISAGWMEWLALKSDGTAIRNGWDSVPTDLSNIVAISASSGTDHHISLAIKSDGTVAGWGFDFYGYGTGRPMVPAGLSNVVAVSSDSSHCLALVGGGRPFLANRLVGRTAVMSGKTFFRVEATGAWPLSYQWKHEGTNLPGATTAILALSNLQSSQAGDYSVSVSNPYGAITSGEVSLALAPLLITKPLDQLTFAGGTASFSVVAQGSRPFGYQWKMGGTAIEGATNSLLTLTDVQFDDAGSYSVTVTNAFGVATSEEAFLSVVPSRITAGPKDQVAFVGGPASFHVVAEASAPPSYQWSVNGIEMDGATNATLALAGLQPAQAGAYSVIVSNVFGTVISKDARLSIVRVATWGSMSQSSVPADLTNVVAIAGNSMALKADSTVASWSGWPDVPLQSECLFLGAELRYFS